MVVGDDRVDSISRGGIDLPNRVRAGVYGHNQACAGFSEVKDRVGRQAVPFLFPVRDIWQGVATDTRDGVDENGRSRQAVDVEIAKDADTLAGRGSRQKSGGRGVHIGEIERAGQSAQVGVQELAGLPVVRDAPVVEKPCREGSGRSTETCQIEAKPVRWRLSDPPDYGLAHGA